MELGYQWARLNLYQDLPSSHASVSSEVLEN